ncbi:hypothetical protein ABK040_016551 [Willaertia magna]
MPQNFLLRIASWFGQDEVTKSDKGMAPLKNLTIKSIKSNNIDSIMILTNIGSLFGLGNNENGEIGLGNEIVSTEEFTPIPNLENKIKFIECGYKCTFIIDELNQLYFTGNTNIFTGNVEQQFTFTKIQKFNENIKLMRVNFNTLFIVTENNLLYVLGKNNNGQLGLGHKNPIYNSFIKNDALQHVKIKDLKCSEHHTIILDENGIVYSCGDSGGNHNEKDNCYFKPIDFLQSKIKSISVTTLYSCLFSYNNEIFIVRHLKSSYDYTVTTLPVEMNLLSLFSDNINSDCYSSFITTENKIYVHKFNGELTLDNNFKFGDYVKLKDSLGDTLPFLKIVAMDYGAILLLNSDYLINEDVDCKDCIYKNLFFLRLKNQLMDYKNLFIDIQFI